jgi:tRNA(fMet)-specific endonuclease VapC
MFILDSDIYSLGSYDYEPVTRRLASCKDQVAITIITRLEVLTGRAASVLKASDSEQLRQAQSRLLDSEAILSGFHLIWFDDAAFEILERMRANKKLSRKMGLKDLLIACIALAHDATLVTRNTKDFANIPNLKLDNWAE